MGFTNSLYTYLPGFVGIGGRPNLLELRLFATIGRIWAATALTRASQNSTISSLSDFAYPGQYHSGNAGKRYFLHATRHWLQLCPSRKEWQLKERLKLQFRFDFQNPWRRTTGANMTITTVDLKNVDASGNPTTANLFGKIPSGNEATSVADGGVPMMNLTLKLRW